MKYLLYFFTFLLATSQLYAQDDKDNSQQREQKVQALYVAYITQQLKLTEDEAKKFWPVHAEFDGEIRSVKLDMPELERQQTVLNIKKKYQDRFSKIIGNSRTDDFFRTDAEFRKKLVERLRKMRENNGQRPFRRNAP